MQFCPYEFFLKLKKISVLLDGSMVYDDDKSVIMSFLYLFMILKNTVIIGISLLTNLEMTSTIKVQIHLY